MPSLDLLREPVATLDPELFKTCANRVERLRSPAPAVPRVAAGGREVFAPEMAAPR